MAHKEPSVDAHTWLHAKTSVQSLDREILRTTEYLQKLKDLRKSQFRVLARASKAYRQK
jgi:hypothetical protein